jgi:hypothetical protein
MTFPIGTCPECGGKRTWLSREFNPYPRWTYRHKSGCVAGRFHSEKAQEEEAAAFGACPVHGVSPAMDCEACYALADADEWIPE